MKTDALKKHHFWILFGLVPLFVLIAFVVVSSSVGSEIEKKEGEIKKTKDEIASKTAPKSKALLDEMEKMTSKVDGKKGNLHESNWVRQKDLFTWPTSSQFRNFKAKVKEGETVKDVEVAKLSDLKFGTQIVDNADQFQAFKKKELYQALYSDGDALTPGKNGMADRVAPTQFYGGWQNILRYVSTFSEVQLTSNQLWLLMEDVWIQRSLLDAIKSVNDEMSAFKRVKYEKAGGQLVDDPDSKTAQDPLRRKFRSRTWEVSLEVATKGNKKYLTGTLENITDRLQVLGIGKTLTLRVWLEGRVGPDGKVDVEGIEPVEFRIGSEFLPGQGGPPKVIKDKNGKDIEVPANIVTMQPDENGDKDLIKYPNLIPPGKNVVEIVKVEQVFDSQTVPIRRIDALSLGKVDSRYGDGAYLKPPLFLPPESVDAPAAGGVGTPGGGGTSSGVGQKRPGLSGTGGAGPSGPPGASGPGGAAAGSGTIDSVVTANLRRYVDVTPQVRRMPVGIVVIVDQSYIQDVLLALANSPLRFQITQVVWNRFRGNLETSTGSGGGSGGPGDAPAMSGPGNFGSGFGTGGGDDERRGGSSGRQRPPGGMGSSMGPMKPTGPGTSTPSYGGGGYGQSGYGQGGMTSVSEAQLTSGLVELQVYGIVSLYEKYTPPADPNAKEPEPMPTDKTPKDQNDPMTGSKTTPKMRVRRRVA